jgi:hypothetical protein
MFFLSNKKMSFSVFKSWIITGILTQTADLNDEIKALLRDSADPEQMWYIGSKNGFFKTSNAGRFFTAINEGLVSAAAEGKHIVVDPKNPLHVYVATKTGLWFSRQGAEPVGEIFPFPGRRRPLDQNQRRRPI